MFLYKTITTISTITANNNNNKFYISTEEYYNGNRNTKIALTAFTFTNIIEKK